jgi:hypothetical protein
LLEKIESLGKDENYLTDPYTLFKAVETGLMDAENLKGFAPAKGDVKTSVINGAVHCIDPKTERIISEEERISKLDI